MYKITGEDKSGLSSVVDGVFARPSGNVFDFYLNGTIEGPEEYVEWNHLIRTASDNDIIYLHINCYGGDVMTAIQLMRALSETNAHVIASVEGACMSAATFIFLVADAYEISEHSMFMFHNYSGGTFGKGNEMKEQIFHEEKWAKNLLSKLYANFLTAAEIKDIMTGRDIWMDPAEVGKRLEKRLGVETHTQPSRRKRKQAAKKS